MTPEDRFLDNPPFRLLQTQKASIRLYRLARTRYANLSGVGAAREPGRWNGRGVEAIYSSTEIGTTVSEKLVHLSKDQIPSNLALMTIKITGHLNSYGPDGDMEMYTGANFRTFSTLAAARYNFNGVNFSGAVAVALPSVLIPAWNVVLFTQAPAFWSLVELESVEPFDYDPRFFPENTPVEPSNP